MTGELLDGGGTLRPGRRTRARSWWSTSGRSWCGPCVAEAADLEATYQATKDAGVSFVGINSRDTRDAAKAVRRRLRLTYPSIFDPAGKVALGFAVPPTSDPDAP